ncbi:hypothetical protein BDN71DRAFT_1457398 [Pleurotus eryngii]|uniref:Uncharacterized protein n=1 Tax=Pleurotus eryngii TaxID=5323 RepID=A0A9P5ZHZ2_PLEER|nr:hypothetical protein BDN71DRAFT_1457398 [Pleurotus eryngii]
MSHTEMHRPSIEGLFELRQQQYLEGASPPFIVAAEIFPHASLMALSIGRRVIDL